MILTIALSNLAVHLPYASIAAALALTLLSTGAHNYLHQADSVRMYYIHLSGMSHSEWRVSHAMSHHMYTNTLLDMEAIVLEPVLSWMPGAAVKNVLNRFVSWIYGPLVYSLFFAVTVIGRYATRIMEKQTVFQAEDIILWALPGIMYVLNVGQVTIGTVMQTWLGIWCMSSCMFAFIGLNAGHHHPETFHDGDEPM